MKRYIPWSLQQSSAHTQWFGPWIQLLGHASYELPGSAHGFGNYKTVHCVLKDQPFYFSDYLLKCWPIWIIFGDIAAATKWYIPCFLQLFSKVCPVSAVTNLYSLISFFLLQNLQCTYFSSNFDICRWYSCFHQTIDTKPSAATKQRAFRIRIQQFIIAKYLCPTAHRCTHTHRTIFKLA